MKKVSLFFLAIIFALNLIIFPFSAIAAEEANDNSLEEIVRSKVVKKCKGTVDEKKFYEFINFVKTTPTGDFCYDCKRGIVMPGSRGKCNVRIMKDGPNHYIVK